MSASTRTTRSTSRAATPATEVTHTVGTDAALPSVNENNGQTEIATDGNGGAITDENVSAAEAIADANTDNDNESIAVEDILAATIGQEAAAAYIAERDAALGETTPEQNATKKTKKGKNSKKGKNKAPVEPEPIDVDAPIPEVIDVDARMTPIDVDAFRTPPPFPGLPSPTTPTRDLDGDEERDLQRAIDNSLGRNAGGNGATSASAVVASSSAPPGRYRIDLNAPLNWQALGVVDPETLARLKEQHERARRSRLDRIALDVIEEEADLYPGRAAFAAAAHSNSPFLAPTNDSVPSAPLFPPGLGLGAPAADGPAPANAAGAAAAPVVGLAAGLNAAAGVVPAGPAATGPAAAGPAAAGPTAAGPAAGLGAAPPVGGPAPPVAAPVPPVAAPVPPVAAPVPPVAAPVPPVGPPAPPLSQWGTSDGQPPRGTFTLMPRRPDIAFNTATHHARLGSLQRTQWGMLYHFVRVIVMGGNGNIFQTRGGIQQTFGDRLNMDPASINVVAPVGDSVEWAVVGLHPYLEQTVLGDVVLRGTARRAACLVSSTTSLPPDTLNGANTLLPFFQNAMSVDGVNRVAEFRRAVTADSSVYQAQAQAQNPPVHLTEPAVFQRFMQTVRLEPQTVNNNGMPRTLWNVRVMFPTRDPAAVARIISAFTAFLIPAGVHGIGVVHNGFTCSICLSTAHPTPLCPFPNLPGWNGPTPETIQALLDQSRIEAEKQRKLFANNGVQLDNGAGPSNGGRGNGNNGRGNNGGRNGGNNGRKGQSGGKGRGRRN
ncbi:hypothetical protein HMN09_00211200 [Mycena chlorophos]|uniref:Uncharacterized protein n=1 Tax=Mycena chlorophos TaxID=658473 RepID=A0A8H6TR16_MYCCL|nr:hypothetical protein HMN09_00211200 [Mycena chlorophos]